jgi:CheY-like chemotaxis protein
MAAKDYKRALAQVAKVYAIDPQNYYAQTYSERIDILLDQEARGTSQPVVVQRVQEEPQPVRTEEEIKKVQEPTARLELYRQMLKEMWFDGQLTEAEVQELKKTRQLFGLSDEVHTELEKQVHIDAYVEALTIAWRDASLGKNDREVLEAMRKKFSITMEQHMSAEAKLLWIRNTPKAKAQILIADDEQALLLALAANLKKHGYDVITAESVEKALEILSLSTPAIILSDLVFAPGAMGGLEFYERIRNDSRLKDIPFLLMSGFSDEFIVRAGMRMGIDSFFQKPFSLELLLATIEGRISQK